MIFPQQILLRSDRPIGHVMLNGKSYPVMPSEDFFKTINDLINQGGGVTFDALGATSGAANEAQATANALAAGCTVPMGGTSPVLDPPDPLTLTLLSQVTARIVIEAHTRDGAAQPAGTVDVDRLPYLASATERNGEAFLIYYDAPGLYLATTDPAEAQPFNIVGAINVPGQPPSQSGIG